MTNILKTIGEIVKYVFWFGMLILAVAFVAMSIYTSTGNAQIISNETFIKREKIEIITSTGVEYKEVDVPYFKIVARSTRDGKYYQFILREAAARSRGDMYLVNLTYNLETLRILSKSNYEEKTN